MTRLFYHQRKHLSIIITGNSTETKHFKPSFPALSNAQHCLMHFASAIFHDILHHIFKYSIVQKQNRSNRCQMETYFSLLNKPIMCQCFIRKWYGLKEETQVWPPIIKGRPRKNNNNPPLSIALEYLHCLQHFRITNQLTFRFFFISTTSIFVFKSITK